MQQQFLSLIKILSIVKKGFTLNLVIGQYQSSMLVVLKYSQYFYQTKILVKKNTDAALALVTQVKIAPEKV